MSKYLIVGGKIITSEESFIADILVSNGKIADVGIKLSEKYPILQKIDAVNKFIIPGGIDPHVHFHLHTNAGYSSDDFETGSKAAIAGGTTSVIDFVTPARSQSYIEALNERISEAANSYCNYSFHMSPTWWGDNSAKEMEICCREYGITSFKTYLAYKASIGIDDDVLLKVLVQAKKQNSIVLVHCEDGDTISKLQRDLISEGKVAAKYHPVSRPVSAEVMAVKKLIKLVEKTNASAYIVHLTSSKSLALVDEAKKRGLSVFAETCPHYLFFDERVYFDNDFYKVAPFVLSPPIRGLDDKDALWQGIADGRISTFATDHCPFLLHGQKDIGINNFTKIANGTGSVEHRMSLLYSYGVEEGRISMNKFVDLVSTSPAKLFGMYPQKGEIAIGSDADIVIWSPKVDAVITTENSLQNCDHTIYENFKTKGKAEIVIVNGDILFNNNIFKAEKPKGKFIRRKL